MLKNYIKTLLRSFRKNKAYSLINITGLSIGMAAALMILLWVQNELSMERFHDKADRIQVMYNRDADTEGNRWAWASTPKILAPTLIADYPEVENAARFNAITFLFTQGEKNLNARGAFTDPGFLEMFSFPLINGEATTALQDAHGIVLTEKFAETLFGSRDAMGQTLRLDSNRNVVVTGILKDLPNNTLFTFDYLLPWEHMVQLGWNDSSWTQNSVTTYTLLKAGTDRVAFDENIKNITIKHSKTSNYTSTTEVFTQPLNRYYLYNKSENGQLVAGNLVTVRLFMTLAVFILLIACINFMNLSTARSERRAKEVGIRKVAGVSKSLLIAQFLLESLVLCLISFCIALLMVYLSLGAFNQLVGKTLYIPFENPVFWLSAIGFIIITSITAGSYPAFYLSSFNPVSVLKGTFKKQNALIAPRKILVTIQFTFAIILMIATIIVYRQIQHGLNRDTGYDQDNLVYIFNQGDIPKHYASIKNELLNSGTATSITQSANPITQRWADSWGFQWEGSTLADEKLSFLRLGTDADFIKTFGIELLEGRDIDVYKFATDSMAVLLNETAVKEMGLKNPVGSYIKWAHSDDKLQIVGVVRDFILESPFEQTINPMLITGPAAFYPSILHIKLNSNKSTAENLASMSNIFKTYNPSYPFEYIFADENYANKFKSAERTGKLAGLFALLTILISCLGLFALAAYMAETRTKEIGVRKVLGASVLGVTRLLTKDFLKLVMFSFLIASPIAWYATNQWLSSYSYRIQIEWWIFALTGLLAAIIAVCTVSTQAIRAAMANPVKSLRDE